MSGSATAAWLFVRAYPRQTRRWCSTPTTAPSPSSWEAARAASTTIYGRLPPQDEPAGLAARDARIYLACAWRGAEQGNQGIVFGCDQFGAELQYAGPLLIGLDDLDPLPGHRFAPVVPSGLGIELAQSRDLVGRALQDLTD
jgi:hypothetical protein